MKNKVIEYKEQGNVAFQLFMRSQKQGKVLDFEDLMSYSLIPVPYGIEISDGFLAKTGKSKSFKYLTSEIENLSSLPEEKSLVFEGGNLMFYYIKDILRNFGHICNKCGV